MNFIELRIKKEDQRVDIWKQSELKLELTTIIAALQSLKNSWILRKLTSAIPNLNSLNIVENDQ